MKKSLLLMSAFLLVATGSTAARRSVIMAPDFTPSQNRVSTSSDLRQAPQREEGEETPSLDFTYAGSPANAYSFNNVTAGKYVYQAFKFSKEDQAAYIGNKISGITVTTGTSENGKNLVAKVDAFITDNLNELPTFQTSNKLVGTAYTQVPISLENPYTITGEKDLYIGYRFKFNRACYYVVVDEVTTDQETCMIAIANTESTVPSFANYADQIGSICMAITISGDNLPMDVVSPTGIDVLSYYAPGTDIEYDLTVKNFGANRVESFVVHTEVTNGSKSDYTITQPLEVGETATFTISGIANPTEGSFELASSITEVNGKTVENPIILAGSYDSYSGGYPRRAVIEEGTGTWCGYCPRGIVMMEYLKENYPDWIRIAVHSGDRMEVASYGQMISKYYTGFPQAFTNRVIDTPVAGDDDSYYKPIYRQITTIPANVKVDLEAAANEDNTEVYVTATTEFSTDNDNNKLQLSFVIVEDGVGPYNQTNYYAGGSYGPLNGWESKGNPEPTMYDDVARLLDGYPGIANSIPESVQKDTPYTFERTISLMKNENTSILLGEEQNFRVIALVVNPTTGEIINACEAKPGVSAVKGINGEKVTIAVENGSIVVNGAKNVNIYSLDGRKVSADNIGSGIYIVTADGVSRKILIK